MKKALCMLTVVLLSLSLLPAWAQEDLEVMALNTIGYIKKELPADGKLITVSLPLFSMTHAEHVFGNLSMATEAPALSEVSFWDPIGQQWVGGTKAGKGGWPANVVTQRIESGEFFFLKGPAAGGATEITITGEVPADSALSRNMPGGGSLGSMANPFPADFIFGDSALAANASALSEVSFWDVNDQQWVGGTKAGKGGWPVSVQTQRVVATEGFFMKEAGAVSSWDVTKPYTWP